MDITVNGSVQTVEGEDLNIARLLEINKVLTPEMVAVQLNGSFVEKAAYAATLLRPDDEVEFLYFMGGGGA